MKDKHAVEIRNKNTRRLEARLEYSGKGSKKKAEAAALAALCGSTHEVAVSYFAVKA